MEDVLKDLIDLLGNDNRPDVQLLTLDNILALSTTSDGLKQITHKELLDKVVSLLRSKHPAIRKTAASLLVNVSVHQNGLENEAFINTLIENIVDSNSDIADSACMVLSNVTRSAKFSEKILDVLELILSVFGKTKHNTNDHNLYYLGPVLSNLSQSAIVRRYILDESKGVLQELLPFVEFKDSVIKRGGVVGTIRNCCFESEYHEWLLSDKVDILPRLLLPLTGNEEFDDEEHDKLPCDLQYMPNDKEREPDPDIRCMLLEALTLLCALRKNREFVRDQNTYVILRELHKWEKDKKALLACENLVDILIRTEEEINKDNLRDADIPEDLVKRFEEMDKQFLHD